MQGLLRKDIKVGASEATILQGIVHLVIFISFVFFAVSP